MTDHTITASFNYTATPEGLHGFLDTVIDSSPIDYWDDGGLKYEKIKTELVSSSTWITSLEVTYNDPTTGEPLTVVLNHDLIVLGTSKLLAIPHQLNPGLTAEVFELASENRLGECDAEQVDAILQMALFGELVYG